MRGRRDEVIRVGARLVLAIAVVGLLVLALTARAEAEEACAEIAEKLATLAPVTAAERVAAANVVLAHDVESRWVRFGTSVAELAWRSTLQASPTRLLRSARRVWKRSVGLTERTAAEDRALELLEGEVGRGAVDADGTTLYARLRRRELADRLETHLANADEALERGELLRATRLVGLARALEPMNARALALDSQISLQRELDEWRPDVSIAETVAPWEPSLAAALLRSDFDAVLGAPANDADSELAQAVALWLDAQHDHAVDRFAALASGKGRAARLARDWHADETVNLERALAEAELDHARRRALGWIGGPLLADNAFALSQDGYAAWRDSLSPWNVALSVPARMLTGWRPEAFELRDTAQRYLDVNPDGARAADARDWLAELGAEDRAWPFDDGLLVLPGARTPFRRLTSQHVLLSRDAVELVGFEAGDSDPDGWLLQPVRGLDVDPSDALDAASALALTSAVADALETRELFALDGARTASLEALRRFDDALLAGASAQLTPWYRDALPGMADVKAALVAGETSVQSDRVEVERDRKGVRVNRAVRDVAVCPVATVCIGAPGRVEGDLFARVDFDGELRVGAHSQFREAVLGFEVGEQGASAAVVLPIARWLGVGRWLPLGARIGIGLTGISIDPELRNRASAGPPNTALAPVF